MVATATQSRPQRQAKQQHPQTRQLTRHPRAGRTNLARKNVGENERLLSLFGGGALAAVGLTDRSLGGLLLAALGGALVYRGLTGHCSCYEALGINTADHSPQASIPAGRGGRIDDRIVVGRSPAELFRFWRNLENLPKFMSHLKSVTPTNGNRSHWVVDTPTGLIEWDAEIITERPNELIAWRSLEGSLVDTAGSVHFRPMAGGTEVRVELKYLPPGGQLGAKAAGLLGFDPATMVRDDLRRFKQLMESPAGVATGG